MKVLIIGSRVPFPLRDGGAIATYNLLKGLSEQGAIVDYISLNTLKHFVDENTLKNEFSFLNNIKTFKIDTSIKAFSALLNLFGNSSYNIDRFYSTEFAKMLQAEIDVNAYDIIHFEGLFVARYLEKIQFKGPKILRQHNIEFKIWQSLAHDCKNTIKKAYLRLLSRRLERFERHITPLFDHIVSITEADQAVSQDIFQVKNINSIPAGIRMGYQAHVNLDSNTLYHIGSMEWMPNQEAMRWFHSDIWPRILADFPEAEFYMAGKNMPDEFKKWDDAKFHVIGEVSDLNQFIGNKSILIVPLKSGSGIRIKTIEGMMAGKSVVSTEFGAIGLKLVHDENCKLANTANEFAKACVDLLKNQELKSRISKNAQVYAEQNFGNESVSKKWILFYSELLKNYGTAIE